MSISELELNPVIVHATGEGVTIVDALGGVGNRHPPGAEGRAPGWCPTKSGLMQARPGDYRCEALLKTQAIFCL